MRRKRHQVHPLHYFTSARKHWETTGRKKNRSPSAVGGTISAPTSSDTLSPTSGVSQNHQEGTNSLGKKQSEKPKDRTPSLNTSSKKSSLYNCLQNTSKHHVQIRPRNSLFGPWFSPFSESLSPLSSYCPLLLAWLWEQTPTFPNRRGHQTKMVRKVLS